MWVFGSQEDAALHVVGLKGFPCTLGPCGGQAFQSEGTVSAKLSKA